MRKDLWQLYSIMLKSRLFEELVKKYWEEGLITSEMHLGTGEEIWMDMKKDIFR